MLANEAKQQAAEAQQQEQTNGSRITVTPANDDLTTTGALQLVGAPRRKPRWHRNAVVFHEKFAKAYVARLTTKLEQHHVRGLDGARPELANNQGI